MTEESGADPLLVGVLAGPAGIDAMLVERTPFGRLASAGRRVSEDVDGPTRFVPYAMERQLAQRGDLGVLAPDEERAADAFVQGIANAVAKLTFGLRAERVRVGLAVDAHLDGRGRDVVAHREGPRVRGLPEAVESALRGRGIELDGPVGRALHVGEAWAVGERVSALGLLGDLARGERGHLVHWDQEVSLVHVVAGSLPRGQVEPPGSRADLGFRGLEPRWRSVSAGRRLLPAARRGDSHAVPILRRAAALLGTRVGARVVADERDAERVAQDGGAVPGPARIVLAGTLGRALLDGRLDGGLLTAFEGGIASAVSTAPDLARRAELLGPLGAEGDPSSLAGGVVQISREANAPLIGAAALALGSTWAQDGAAAPDTP